MAKRLRVVIRAYRQDRHALLFRERGAVAGLYAVSKIANSKGSGRGGRACLRIFRPCAAFFQR